MASNRRKPFLGRLRIVIVDGCGDKIPAGKQRLAIYWRKLGVGVLSVALLVVFASAGVASPPRPDAAAPSAEELLLQAAGENQAPCRRYRARNWLREKLICEDDYSRYGLQLDDEQQIPINGRVVILVHGFNSTPQQNAAVLTTVRSAGLRCGSFAYPNDHTVLASAQLLSSELRRFGRLHPRCRVVLVCHSMGSLVARACLEDPRYDPGNVERLIMIAPPTHGTLIAHFAVGSDLWEHWLSRRDGGPWRRTRDSIVDGLGEAADDLCPNSAFLHDLNSRPRNSRVRYTVFLGTGARFNEAQLAWIRDSVCDQLAKMPGGEGCADRLESILSDIDELVEGKGDGVVAVKRGRLDGVSDTLVMPFGHLAVTGEPNNDALRDVQRAVVERLR
jgi:pimeloyl-ACP methyl ester carboxylesterase